MAANSTVDYYLSPYKAENGTYTSLETGETLSRQEALTAAVGDAIDNLNKLTPRSGPLSSTRAMRDNQYIASHPQEIALRREELLGDIAELVDAGADLHHQRDHMTIANHHEFKSSLAEDLGHDAMVAVNAKRNGSSVEQAAANRESQPTKPGTFQWSADKSTPKVEIVTTPPTLDRSVHHKELILEAAGYETTSLAQAKKGADGIVDDKFGRVAREAQSHMIADLSAGKLSKLSPELLADLKNTFAPELQAMNRHNGGNVATAHAQAVSGTAQTTQVATR